MVMEQPVGDVPDQQELSLMGEKRKEMDLSVFDGIQHWTVA